MAAKVMNFVGILRDWYKKNKRDLPWRRTRDPYRVWLSEVILQQTRIAQGMDYYERFITAFPDVHALAAAREDDVLKLWQGLGYYSRARNLHLAAREVAGKMEGKFPTDYRGLLALKGVGPYTAAAVASICFGEPVAVVDGNVSRVISRLFGVEDPVNATAGRRTIASLAAMLMEEGAGDPGTHNQAMMEFGALLCTPRLPECGSCPLSAGCRAFAKGLVNRLPVMIPAGKPAERWYYFYVIYDGQEVILTRRSDQGIWKSLYHFPLVESAESWTEQRIQEELYRSLFNGQAQHMEGRDVQILTVSPVIPHRLTHLAISARFIHVKVDLLPVHEIKGSHARSTHRVPFSELDRYPVPRLIERYLESAKF
jgi:A/G-specific adenine glycosylase